MIACVILASRRRGELHLIEVSEVVRHTTCARGSRNTIVEVPFERRGHHSLLQKLRPLLFNSSLNKYLNESPPVFGTW